MTNSTQPISNMTTYVNNEVEKARLIFFSVVLPLFCVLSYFMAVILHTFFTVPHVRENPRYMLFIHMLINDVSLLAVSIFIFTCAVHHIYIPLPLCYTIATYTSCAFQITPYNLTVMSLERYAAICHPLRHAELCTAQKCNIAIAIMWTVGLIPQIADFIAFCSSAEKRVFLSNVFCDWPLLIINEAQVVLRTATTVVSFTTVGLIIIYTYVKVMLVAWKIDSGKSATKAGRTVLLHAFQLMLCMLSFTSIFTERYFKPIFRYTPLINFIMFLCLPRVISPLIYGVRDEVFGKHMRKIISSWQSSSIQ